MSWTTAASDLRTSLSDNATDKLRYRKQVFGEANDTNTSFKTFEFRRITDFKTAAAPLGVYKAGVLLATSAISIDFVETGDFDLTAAPTEGQKVEASYYVQWFNDAEINQFLRISCNWLALGDTFSNIPEGLRPAALKYASAEAYQKLALRWAENLSEGFLLEDAKDDKRMSIVDAYMKAATAYRKEATSIRDDFYSRSGTQLSPTSSSLYGIIPPIVPNK